MTVAELSETASRPDTRTADITVVGGAGHVGIPLVLSFAAKGMRVNVNDLNVENLAALESGRLPFIEYGAGNLLTDALRDRRLSFTSKPSEISASGPVIVTIGDSGASSNAGRAAIAAPSRSIVASGWGRCITPVTISKWTSYRSRAQSSGGSHKAA